MNLIDIFDPSGRVLSDAISVLIKVTLILAAALVVARCLSRQGPALRHAVLMSGLIATAFVPVIAWIMNVSQTMTLQLRILPANYGLNELGLIRARDFDAQELPLTTTSANDQVRPVTSNPQSSHVEQATVPAMSAQRLQLTAAAFVNLLLAVWLIGLIVGFVALAGGLIRARRLIRRSRECRHLPWIEALHEVRQSLGTVVTPRLLVSSATSTPVVVGALKPAIVLPASLEDGCSAEEMRGILLHEMAHIVRRDILIGWIQRVIAILWWPHPLVRRLNRRLSQAREEICDNYVLRTAEKHEYAQTLLTLSLAASNATPFVSAVGMVEPKWSLEARIRGLLDSGRKMNVRVSFRTKAAVLLLAVMGTLFLAGVTARSATDQEVIEETRRLGGQFTGPNGEPDKSERLMILGDWRGDTTDLRNLKEIKGIKDIWFSGVKFDEVILEDMPDLETISFITNYYDEDVGKQMNVTSLPIKTVRLKNLPKITRFDHRGGGNNLHATQITRLELTNMHQLTDLTTEGLQLCNDVLLAVSGAPNLTSVAMTRPISSRSGGRTQITDAGLKSLPSLKKLASLDLSGARITDKGLATIGSLKSLKSLGISATETTDKGLAQLADLTELMAFGLEETSITNAGLKQIVANHPKLEFISVGQTAISDEGLAPLQTLRQLKSISVDAGQLTKKSCALLEKSSAGSMTIHGTVDRPGQLSGLSNLLMAYLDGDADLTVAEGSLRGLKTLFIRGTTPKTVRALFNNFRSCEELEYLELSYGWNIVGAVDADRAVSVDDGLMQSLSHLRKLKFLWFDGFEHEFGDVGLRALENLSDLETIMLPVTRATNDGMAVFANCKKLTRLRIGGEAISNGALAHFRGLKQLRELTFTNTLIDQAAVEQLKLELPNTTIQVTTYKKP